MQSELPIYQDAADSEKPARDQGFPEGVRRGSNPARTEPRPPRVTRWPFRPSTPDLQPLLPGPQFEDVPEPGVRPGVAMATSIADRTVGHVHLDRQGPVPAPGDLETHRPDRDLAAGAGPREARRVPRHAVAHRHAFSVELAAAEHLMDRPESRAIPFNREPELADARPSPADFHDPRRRADRARHSATCRSSDLGVRPFIDRFGWGGPSVNAPSSTDCSCATNR